MMLALRQFLLCLSLWLSIVAPISAQNTSAAADHFSYVMPSSRQVTVAAEGGLIFQMKVNGQGPFRTIFDTGAVNVISADFTKQLGLKVEEKAISFGAIGGSIKARTVHIDTLTIGDLTINNQTFYVLDIPADSGTPQMLVGWEFMRAFAVRMDFQHNQLTFFDGKTFKGTGNSVPLILHTNGNGIDVMAKVDGIEGRFLVDSGNQSGTFLSAVFGNRNNLVQKLNAHLLGYNGRGFGGDSPQAYFVRLHTFQIGKLKINGPVSRLQTANDSFNETLAGNIGQDILGRFTVTVDCQHAMMYLEKNPGWNKPGAFNRTGMLVDFNQDSDEVKTVFPGSPADAAGLKRGDRIVKINGKTPSNDPNDPLFTQPVGTVLHLEVKRGEILQLYEITLRDVL
jgi:hypothetical protein